MANAIDLLIGADSRGLEKEFAKNEVLVQRFGKNIAKRLDEATAANSASTLQAMRSTMATIEGQMAQTLAGTVNYKKLETQLTAVRTEYNLLTTAIKSNEAAMAAAAVASAASSATPAGNIPKTLEEAHKHIPGLSSVIRESLVLVREISAGRWSKVPGSFSILVQALRAMRERLGVFGAIFTLTGLTVVASIGGIIAAWKIWEYRVHKLTDELIGLSRVNLPAPDISRLSAFEQGWQKIREAVDDAVDSIQSANSAFEQTTKMMDESQRAEKDVLEIQKEKAMADAGNDPEAKARVRAEYLQKEHDLEQKHFDEQLAAQRQHIDDLKSEQDKKNKEAENTMVRSVDNPDVMVKVLTEEDARSTGEIFKKQVEANHTREKDKEGKEVAGSSPLEKAQAIVDELEKVVTIPQYNEFGQSVGTVTGLRPLSETDQARLDAARDTLEQGKRDQMRLTRFEQTKKERDEARKRQAKLYQEAGQAGADAVKSQDAYSKAQDLDRVILANNDKARKMRADLEDAKDLEHSSGRGAALQLNAHQKIGTYAAAPADLHRQVALLHQIVQNTQHLRPDPQRPPGARPPNFGGHPKH